MRRSRELGSRPRPAASLPSSSGDTPISRPLLRNRTKRAVKLEAEALAKLHGPVSDRPGMDALASEWLGHNLHGVRHLTRKTLDEILDAGDRAFNLRVADPYLRYQMQGQGFTWSFFTHKDTQDCHVHGAAVVEIYGILEGEPGNLVEAVLRAGDLGLEPPRLASRRLARGRLAPVPHRPLARATARASSSRPGPARWPRSASWGSRGRPRAPNARA